MLTRMFSVGVVVEDNVHKLMETPLLGGRAPQRVTEQEFSCSEGSEFIGYTHFRSTVVIKVW